MKLCAVRLALLVMVVFAIASAFAFPVDIVAVAESPPQSASAQTNKIDSNDATSAVIDAVQQAVFSAAAEVRRVAIDAIRTPALPSEFTSDVYLNDRLCVADGVDDAQIQSAVLRRFYFSERGVAKPAPTLRC